MIDNLRPLLYAMVSLILFLRGYADAALVLLVLAVLFAAFFWRPFQEAGK